MVLAEDGVERLGATYPLNWTSVKPTGTHQSVTWGTKKINKINCINCNKVHHINCITPGAVSEASDCEVQLEIQWQAAKTTVESHRMY